MSTKPLLLDGSMGQEIVNRGGKSNYGEWAVAALYEAPEMVKDIHRDYLLAGADVLTTNTYSTTRTRLRYREMENQFETLVHKAGSLAQSARESMQATHPNVQIAGGLGPLEASYVNEFNLSYDEMVTEFDELMTLLEPYVDLYLGETFSTILEARAFLTAAKRHDKPTWVSWTLEDHASVQLRGGETLSDAIESIKPLAPDTILVNCCTPNSIDLGIDILKASELPFGGYANGFVEISPDWEPTTQVDSQVAKQHDLTPERYGQHATKWMESGATIIGGCCDIGPAHIAHLRQIIDKDR